MNDADLDRILKRAQAPEPPEEYWDDLSRRISGRLGRAMPPSRPAARWRLRLAWGLATATVCVALGFAVGRWRGKEAGGANPSLLANVKVVEQVLAMFPHRVRAIVQDEHGLRLVLSENENVPDSTPLLIEVSNGRQSSSFVTFSGQEVRIDGQAVTVLSDAQGGVILVGNSFLWSNRELLGAADGLRIQARELTGASPG